MMILHQKTIILPNSSELLDLCITNDTKYFFYFKKYLRALDGIYLPAHLSAVIASPYGNRKGWLS